jgi:hypothetical protein
MGHNASTGTPVRDSGTAEQGSQRSTLYTGEVSHDSLKFKRRKQLPLPPVGQLLNSRLSSELISLTIFIPATAVQGSSLNDLHAAGLGRADNLEDRCK